LSLESAAGALFAALRDRGLTLAGAESCTGGLASAAITAMPGASGVFLGSVVAYSNRAKERLLSVPEGVISRHGAVSGQCALAMAEGAASAFAADCSFSVTGIAGPGGALPGKPVGTVWIACRTPGESRTERLSLQGDRDSVRLQAAERALAALASLAGARISLDNPQDEGVSSK